MANCTFIKRFPHTIKSLCQAYGVDLYALDLDKDLLYLKLQYPESSGYMPLVIETLGDRQISIAHYYHQHGDAIADPDLVCYISPTPELWLPLLIKHPPPFGEQVAAKVVEGRIQFNAKKQKDIASFTNTWSSNIRNQQWFLKGNKPNPELTVTVEVNCESLERAS
ncbi:MAG: hypothetical protein AB4058_11385 [Microcystaceae cyanobacterium]